jgi:hypothetical protein
LRDAAKRVVCIFDGLEEERREEGGDGLFHWLRKEER